jgi:hypothetical protein
MPEEEGSTEKSQEPSCGERCPTCAKDDVHNYCDKELNHGGYHRDWKWHEW